MRISIRDLFWATLLAAVFVSWWIDHDTQRRRIADLEQPDFGLASAEGVITQRGVPLSNVIVTVVYPDGNFAIAVSDESGNFTLFSFGRVGAVPGKQLPVIVQQMPGENSTFSFSTTYGDVKTTPLRLDIPEKGSGKLSIRLE